MRNDALALTIHSTEAGRHELIERAREFLKKVLVPEETAAEIMVIIDELAANIGRHAWPEGGAHDFRVLLCCRNEVPGSVIITFDDNGIAFDPRTADVPAEDVRLEKRPIGGLGLALVRSLSDELYYRRYRERNRSTVVKRIPVEPAMRG